METEETPLLKYRKSQSWQCHNTLALEETKAPENLIKRFAPKQMLQPINNDVTHHQFWKYASENVLVTTIT